MRPEYLQYESIDARPGLFALTARLWRHLTIRRRRQLRLLGALILASAFSEVISLGALLPFLGVLISPAPVLKYPLVAKLMSVIGVTGADGLIWSFAALFATAAVVTGILRLALLAATSRLAYGISGDFGIEIYRRTLYQPYAVHVARHTSSVLSGIAHKVDSATKMLVGQLNLGMDLVLLVAVVATLVMIQPTLALFTGLAFTGSYMVASWLARRRLRENGLLIAHEQTNIIKVVQEGLGGIRDVLLDGTQAIYTDSYLKASYPLRRALSDNQFIQGAPRNVMETAGIILIVSVACWLAQAPGGLVGSLPTLGVMALGGQRLLPVLQQAYASWASVMMNVMPVSDVLDMLDQPLPPEDRPPPPLEFVREIRFNNVRFRYSPEGPWVLDGLNLSIPRGMRIGMVGATGSGKSTLLDLLTGLLEAQDGTLTVDGLPLSGERLRAWQRTVAHVPQTIYLCDATIAQNIAMSSAADIDMTRVREAAAAAQIAEFVESSPKGYSAMIGERGIRLSGGQRQRIAIARALYKQGSVLIFDEATSALDNATEQSVMDTIAGLNRDLTIIIIAHRVTTVRQCDRIVELIDGRAVAYQSYEHMVEHSPSARSIFLAS